MGSLDGAMSRIRNKTVIEHMDSDSMIKRIDELENECKELRFNYSRLERECSEIIHDRNKLRQDLIDRERAENALACLLSEPNTFGQCS